MKQIKLALFMSIILIVGCKKEEKAEDTVETPKPSIEVTVDGVNFSTDKYSHKSLTNTSGRFLHNVSADLGGSKTISITFYGDSVSSYKFNDMELVYTDVSNYYGVLLDPMKSYIYVETLDKDKKILTGTFSALLGNGGSKSVKISGAFNSIKMN